MDKEIPYGDTLRLRKNALRKLRRTLLIAGTDFGDFRKDPFPQMLDDVRS